MKGRLLNNRISPTSPFVIQVVEVELGVGVLEPEDLAAAERGRSRWSSRETSGVIRKKDPVVQVTGDVDVGAGDLETGWGETFVVVGVLSPGGESW